MESQKVFTLLGGLVIVEKGSLRGQLFEGLSRGVRGEGIACKGHPYMFLTLFINFLSNFIILEKFCKF